MEKLPGEKMRKIGLLLMISLAALLYGCSTRVSPEDVKFIPESDFKPIEKPDSFGQKDEIRPKAGFDSMLTGQWRLYSDGIFYDDGEFEFRETKGLLDISDGNEWEFGNSKGTWQTSPIAEEDWGKWGVKPYGPSKKIILNGWNGGIADGPIEEAYGSVAFVWVIYRVEPPLEKAPGQVQKKFAGS